MDLETLPVLSLADAPATLARDLGDSFATFGFAMVKDHGLDPALVARAWGLTAQFFALPEAEKRGYLIPGQGGIMDQLDSVAFAAPVFYHLTRFIWSA